MTDLETFTEMLTKANYRPETLPIYDGSTSLLYDVTDMLNMKRVIVEFRFKPDGAFFWLDAEVR